MTIPNTRRMQLLVAGMARDVEDCRELLGTLGLIPKAAAGASAARQPTDHIAEAERRIAWVAEQYPDLVRQVLEGEGT